MTPTEFLQNKNIVAEDKTDLIIGFDNGTKESLIDLLEKYHQAKLNLLGIANAVGRSEQLVNFLLHLNDKELINSYDFDYAKEAKKYLKNES